MDQRFRSKQGQKPLYDEPVDTDQSVLVCGGGGFIGGHLVADLVRQGFDEIRVVDRKRPDRWFQKCNQADNRSIDLMDQEQAYQAVEGMDMVYNLAADMGGIGFIERNKARCMLSVKINTNLLIAARDYDVDRYFYASSACVYNQEKQQTPDVTPLKEEDAYPAMPEDGYGWEKLFGERMCRHFREDFDLTTRIARFHNVYGPYGTYDGGREKAPAALTRKVIEAERSGEPEIVIWGNGEQTRSFMFVDDCVLGIQKIMHSEVQEPLNLGSNELVTINELVDHLERISGQQVDRIYDESKPQGVDGRNSDNTKIKKHLNWEPTISLEDGLQLTYEWIKADMKRHRHKDRRSIYTCT